MKKSIDTVEKMEGLWDTRINSRVMRICRPLSMTLVTSPYRGLFVSARKAEPCINLLLTKNNSSTQLTNLCQLYWKWVLFTFGNSY